MKPKNIINIINVYAPTSDQAKKCPNEIRKLYKNLDKLCKEFDKAPSSITILAGDFNSKVERRSGSESCTEQWSRGRQNQNGTNLVEFCEKNGKFIASSSFQHPAKHITTWSQRRTNLVAKQNVWMYNQIDYIILNQKKKQVLTYACSQGGIETSSDHRLVAARIELTCANIYHQRMPNASQKRFNTRQLTQNEENQERYRDQINQEAESSTYVAAHQENIWEKLKYIIKCAAETHIGYKKRVNNHQMSDPDFERMSKEQKDIRLQIQNCKDAEKNKHLRKLRKEILKKMNQ